MGEWLSEHSTWRLESRHLIREIDTPDYSSAVTIIQRQVAIAEGLNHHPIITLGYNHLRFELWTHDRDGLTQLDLDYASELDRLIDGEFSTFLR